MNSIDIQVIHHRETLDKQRVDRAVQHPNFVAAWGRANLHQRKMVKTFIEYLDFKEVESWIRRLNFGDLQALTTKELRQEASNNHIVGYSRFTKDELRETLENVC